MLFKRKENPDCLKCKLDKRAYTPKFEYQGSGEKKILFILPSPSPMDDEIGKFGTAIGTDILRTFCNKNYLDLEQDCWIYFALDCSPFDNKNNPFYPEKKYIEYCRPNLYKKIKELNPKVIIPLGNAPIEALYGKRFEDCGIDVNTIIQWRGKAIPDRQLNCWVCPIFDTDWYLEKERDDQAKYIYNKDFANAVDHINIDFPTFTDDNKKCKILLEYQDVIDCLRKIIETKPKMISFDYETNCKRPYPKEAKILTISLYIPELDTSYAFPLFWKEHFSTTHLNRILSLLQKVLTIEGTKYTAHQIAMEDSWTSIKLGFHINGWFWDTMIVQHIIDTTPRTCGLKPQAFFRWGIEGYDKYSKSYMDSDDDESDDGINNLERANLPKVLQYNALDSLYGYRLYEEQLIESEYETNEKRKFCVNLYNEVAVAFTRTSQRGIFTNQEYYAAKQIELEESVKVLREELYDTKEARIFKRSKGIDINFDSSDHMRILFFDLLGFDPKKKTKKGSASADKEALNDIDHPFAKKILEIRSLNKIIGTYFSQFRRLSYDNYIHPEMLLHIARSGRSSCVSPNFQNINKRNKFAKEAVRTGVIPIPGYHMGEIDYDTLEVKIFCCFCKDPALVNYLMDSSSDMHKDQAKEIFLLVDWQITKPIRFEAKNGWVFALFYGSYWRSCARKIWDKICSQKDLILGKNNTDDPDIHLKDHLYSKGIRTQEDFAEHLKKCEEKLWNIFHVTREYQKNAFKSALQNGYVESFFGFRRGGYIERGQIINTPVQGQGCQCLLHSYRQIYKLSVAQHWKSYIVCQIHDSAVDYFHPTEIIPVLNTFRKIMCIDMVKNNDWMIVPMDIEASIGKLNDSWCNLIDFHFDKGKWVTKSGDRIQDVLELPKQVRLI